jgi:hypothetical protein
VSAITRIYTGLSQVKNSLQNVATALSQTIIPTTLIGALAPPDGTHASRVQLQFNPFALGSNGQPVTVLTGEFQYVQLGRQYPDRQWRGRQLARARRFAQSNPLRIVGLRAMTGRLTAATHVPICP